LKIQPQTEEKVRNKEPNFLTQAQEENTVHKERGSLFSAQPKT
jgi:hypothetical protein